MQDDNNKNLILATALSFLVILVWFWFFPPEEPAVVTTAETGVVQQDGTVAPANAVATPAITTTPVEARGIALAKSPRIAINTDRLKGSLSLTGGRIDDLQLEDYNVIQNDDSEKVTLLSPAGSSQAYFAVYGWRPTASMSFEEVPGLNTLWSLEQGTELTPSTPVTLKWDNGNGLIFRRNIAVDDDYMFKITQSVENTGTDAMSLAPFGTLAQIGKPELAYYGRPTANNNGVWILHEGIVRSTDGNYEEAKYKKLTKTDFVASEQAKASVEQVLETGWIGFTGKYWMTTLIPEPGTPFESVYKYIDASETYQADMRLKTLTVAPGQTQSVTTSLFAGAKEYDAIRRYEKEDNINQFVDSIDWGWFFFLTKPIFQILHWLNNILGNMGWSIIGLTLIIKALLFPLAYKSFVSMARMKEIQPEMEKLKEKHGDDRQALQKDMMKLYRDKKVNPAAGCVPILLQIPIFFSLYKVIFVTIELRHAPFIAWIQDLSAPDPTSILNLFGLLPWGAPDASSFLAILSIGVLPVLMGISMWMQQKLNPAPTDKTQAMIFAWMPWVFMFMLGSFASGLVVYWVANNTITFLQQYTIMRSQGVKPDIWGNMFSFLKKNKEAE
jgi:YidC/Oxa1 family membrane protein insertase